MVLGGYTKKQILYYENLGLKPLSIVRELKRDIKAAERDSGSREGFRQPRGSQAVPKWYEETGSIARKPGSGRPTKIARNVVLTP